jgi:hypothetical protein
MFTCARLEVVQISSMTDRVSQSNLRSLEKRREKGCGPLCNVLEGPAELGPVGLRAARCVAEHLFASSLGELAHLRLHALTFIISICT